MRPQVTTREDLVRKASKKSGFPQWKVAQVSNALFGEYLDQHLRGMKPHPMEYRPGVIAEFLNAGKSVEIRGFITFLTRRAKARPAQNPRTGEPVIVPRHKRVKVRFSKDLQAKMNGKS